MPSIPLLAILGSAKIESVGMLDWHYPKADGLEEFAPLFKKPFIASEFAHALGLAYAQLEPVWEKMQSTPAIAGGAVWMFQDQGIRRQMKDKKIQAGGTEIWLDKETCLDANGKAGTDGIVYADRTPQTDYYETKAVFSPVRLGEKVLSAEAGKRKYKIPVENRYDFINLSALTCTWRLMGDTKVLDQGTVSVDCAPHAATDVLVRTTFPAKRPAVSYRLELAFVDHAGTTVAAKAYPISTDITKLATAVKRPSGKDVDALFSPVRLHRLEHPIFDETLEVGVGESAVLYRNKDGFMAWPNETDATAQIRLVSQDGQTVQAYCNNEPMGTPQDLKPLVEAARKTRFNGVGIGILSGTASP